MKIIYSTSTRSESLNLISNKSLIAFAFVALMFAAFSTTVQGQISFSSLNSAYTQNFDGMGTGDFALSDDISGSLLGFYALREFGNANPNFVGSDDGSGITPDFKNYGPSLQLDRALGALPGAGAGGMRFGARFVNSSGIPISSILVTYTGEQWHNGGNQTPHTLVFAYRKDTNVNDLTTGVYTPVAGLSFVSPQTGPVAGPLDGNAAANRTTLSASFPVTILPGEEIMLRWEDLDAFGLDHGLAIDDLSVTPQGASTAGTATISGRVADASGRGIPRTRVQLSGGSLTEPVFALTNAFGYYNFSGIEIGEAYVLRVESKRHRFENPIQFFSLGDNLTDIDFVANP